MDIGRIDKLIVIEPIDEALEVPVSVPSEPDPDPLPVTIP